jgi:hypothetical protein
VSGGFEKHSEKKSRSDKFENSGLQRRQQYASTLNDRAKIEYEADSARLAELEAKLEEVRRKKLMKQMRDQKRNQRKREYEACLTIQSYAKVFVRKRMDFHAEVLKSYLRSLSHGQAIRVAGWAAGVLRRFAKYASFRWRWYMTKRKCAGYAAVTIWCKETPAILRRVQIKNLAPGLVQLHLAHGYHAAVAKIKAQMVQKAMKAMKKSAKKKSAMKKKTMKKK